MCYSECGLNKIGFNFHGSACLDNVLRFAGLSFFVTKRVSEIEQVPNWTDSDRSVFRIEKEFKKNADTPPRQ